MQLTIKKPDDCHAHLREGDLMVYAIPYSERQFNRVVVMPNTQSPLTNFDKIISYYHTLLDLDVKFTPKMTLYLTDETSIQDIESSQCWECFVGCKLYPIGSTVNSPSGISSIEKIKDVLKYMELKDIPLLIHGEDPTAPIMEREKSFITGTLFDLCDDFPKLRIVMEHITTSYAVDLIANNILKNVWATITPHHLLITYDSIFSGNKINPHLFCLPIAKMEHDRISLLKAATSGNPRFFAGTDSAPHPRHKKESEGVPGCFTAPAAIEHYAEAFDSIDKLDKLDDFMSRFGAEFYGWELGKETLKLIKVHGCLPYDSYHMLTRKHQHNFHFSADDPYPFSCGRYLEWRISG